MMEKNKSIIRKILLCLSALSFMVLNSCSHEKDRTEITAEPCNTWNITCIYGWSYTTIQCDSFEMRSVGDIDIYINGKKNTLFAEEFRPVFTKCK
jgi:hypothetical protein